MNILKHELRIYIKSTIIWTISLILLVFIFGEVYPTFKGSINLMNKVLGNFPEGFKAAFGLNFLSFGEPLGFYGFMFTYISLIGSIQAMNLGLSILSNELRDKTADFLMAKPVKRIKILHAKLGSALLCIIITNVFFIIFSMLTVRGMSDGEFSYKIYFYMTFSLILIQLFFLTFGMFVSVFMDKIKTVLPISMGIVFGFFILNMLNESLKGLPLSFMTPFAYFSTTRIYEIQGYNMTWFILNFLLVILFTVGTYIKYIKKDIPSV